MCRKILEYALSEVIKSATTFVLVPLILKVVYVH